MKAATWPRDSSFPQKLLVIREEAIHSVKIKNLEDFLTAGDLLVVNDAATFPASLKAITEKGDSVEIRLLPKSSNELFWQAVLFGAGSWKLKTEDRSPPPKLLNGEILRIGERLQAQVESISSHSYRWVSLKFNLVGLELWREIYQWGRPIQYSYLKRELDLWLVQNCYSSRPWASEMPSAGRSLNWNLLLRWRGQGIQIKAITHATGISSTGDQALDALLPLKEFYEIPKATAEAIQITKAHGNRVIAIGTSVVRALEGHAAQYNGILNAGSGETELVIRAGFEPKVVDGILSGIHEVGESHFGLLEAFASKLALENALAKAQSLDYLIHEFGDSCLVLKK